MGNKRKKYKGSSRRKDLKRSEPMRKKKAALARLSNVPATSDDAPLHTDAVPAENGSGGTPDGPTDGSGGTPDGPTDGSGGTPDSPTDGSGGTPDGPTDGSGGTPDGPTDGTGGTPDGPTAGTGQAADGTDGVPDSAHQAEFPSDCAVRGCNSSSAREPQLLFFALPSNPRRCAHWLRVIGRAELALQDVATLHADYRVCARHFTRHALIPPPGMDDTGAPLPGADEYALPEHAVPTLRLPRDAPKPARPAPAPPHPKQAAKLRSRVKPQVKNVASRTIATQTEPALERVVCVMCERVVDGGTRKVCPALKVRKMDRMITPTPTHTPKPTPTPRPSVNKGARYDHLISQITTSSGKRKPLAEPPDPYQDPDPDPDHGTSDDDHDKDEAEEALGAGGEPLISAELAATAPRAAVFVFEYQPTSEPASLPVNTVPTAVLSIQPNVAVPSSVPYITSVSCAVPSPTVPSASSGPYRSMPSASSGLYQPQPSAEPPDGGGPYRPMLSTGVPYRSVPLTEPPDGDGWYRWAPSAGVPFATVPVAVPVVAPDIPDLLIVKEEDEDMDVEDHELQDFVC